MSLTFPPVKGIQFNWPELLTSYNGVFRTLVFGNFPDANLLKKTLERIKDRLRGMEWRLQIDEA